MAQDPDKSIEVISKDSFKIHVIAGEPIQEGINLNKPSCPFIPIKPDLGSLSRCPKLPNVT